MSDLHTPQRRPLMKHLLAACPVEVVIVISIEPRGTLLHTGGIQVQHVRRTGDALMRSQARQALDRAVYTPETRHARYTLAYGLMLVIKHQLFNK